MSRKGPAKKRKTIVDPIYKSQLITKLTNKIMLGGNKSIAQNIVYKAIEMAGKKEKKNAIEIFEKSIENIKPMLEVKSRRVGGATYQVPVNVSDERGNVLAIRWLVNSARQRNEHSMEEKLATEISESANNLGAAIKKKEDTHKMAESNRAFAHFRW